MVTVLKFINLISLTFHKYMKFFLQNHNRITYRKMVPIKRILNRKWNMLLWILKEFQLKHPIKVQIFFQIVTVVTIFSSYMLLYYLSYHIFTYNDKWIAVLHSVFYSITHISNPVIHISFFFLNKQKEKNSYFIFMHTYLKLS